MDQLRDIMSTDLKYVSPQDNIYQAASLMKEHNVGMVPVVENGKLAGVVTDRDLVIRAIAERKPNSSSVREVMSKELVYGSPDMSVDEAARLMADAQIRRLPVVENGNLVGVVSIGDLAVRESHDQKAARALSEISETHDPHVSSDLQLRN
jgi:CBS domain-containing protein